MPAHPELKRLYPSGWKLTRWSGKQNQAAALSNSELLYERLFSNALLRFGIENRFYPVKSAANYSLLYLILRIVTELPVRRVLELGCGQSSLLLDALGARRELEILTLENNPEWADRVQQLVRHPVRLAPLVEKPIQNHTTLAYGVAPEELPENIDFLIVDGPVGKRHRSRWGCLELLDNLATQDFVILFDDAQRKGELETIGMVLNFLKARGTQFAVGVTQATSSQCVIAGGKYTTASYF